MYYGYNPYWNNSSITVMWSGLYFLTGRLEGRLLGLVPAALSSPAKPDRSCGCRRRRERWREWPRNAARARLSVSAVWPFQGHAVRTRGESPLSGSARIKFTTPVKWACVQLSHELLPAVNSWHCHYGWGTTCELPAELKLGGHIGASVLLWCLLHPSRY